MKSRRWDREEVVQYLRDDVWRYVTQDSLQYKGSDDSLLLSAAALLRMSPAEVRYLAQIDFVLSPVVRKLLDEMPTLIRKLTPTTTSEVEVSTQRVRGSIRWSETYAQRAGSGMPHAYVTTPSRRAFETPENSVLVFALHAVVEFGQRSGWHRGANTGPAKEIRDRVSEATRWLQSRQFADVPIRVPTPITISRVRSGRARLRYSTALDVVELYQRYIARLDRGAIRDAVERRALLVSRDSVLLELHCAFDTITTLRQLGWHSPAVGIVRHPVIFRGHRNGAILELFLQRAPGELTKGSRYRSVQHAHDFANVGGLIPDLVLKIAVDGAVQWILVEVKGGEQRTVAESARAAVRDLFCYRYAFSEVLDGQTRPYGLAYAWGEGLQPSPEGDVRLCTPDTLANALSALMAI